MQEKKEITAEKVRRLLNNNFADKDIKAKVTYTVQSQKADTNKRMQAEKEFEEKVKKIDREIVHFLLTVALSALTALIITSLAIR